VERADTLAQQCDGAAATLPMHIRGAKGEEYMELRRGLNSQSRSDH